MIWRLAHPVQGLVAGLLTCVVLVLVMAGWVGFGVGLPELAVALALSGAVFWLVAARKSAGRPPT